MSFLEPVLESWDIDISTFGMDIVLNHRVASGGPKKIEFVEREYVANSEQEVGLKEFLANPTLSGDATAAEIEFLKRLRFTGKHPNSLYYYRELQNLRDPLHFQL